MYIHLPRLSLLIFSSRDAKNGSFRRLSFSKALPPPVIDAPVIPAFFPDFNGESVFFLSANLDLLAELRISEFWLSRRKSSLIKSPTS